MKELKPIEDNEQVLIPFILINDVIKNKIQVLSEEYNLQSHQNNFLSHAIYCINRMIETNKLLNSNKLFHGKSEELDSALLFLYGYKDAEMKIEFKHTKENISTPIKNPILIEVVRKALRKYFEENDIFVEQGFVKPKDILNFKNYVEFVAKERKDETSRNPKINRKGRKYKYAGIADMIDGLQIFLQNYTNLKAEENIIISRQQASFIYNFLVIIEIIPDNLAWKEDNIRHVLAKYKKRKSSYKPISYNKAMNDYDIYEKSMKAKIKNINKNQ